MLYHFHVSSQFFRLSPIRRVSSLSRRTSSCGVGVGGVGYQWASSRERPLILEVIRHLSMLIKRQRGRRGGHAILDPGAGARRRRLVRSPMPCISPPRCTILMVVAHHNGGQPRGDPLTQPTNPFVCKAGGRSCRPSRTAERNWGKVSIPDGEPVFLKRQCCQQGKSLLFVLFLLQPSGISTSWQFLSDILFQMAESVSGMPPKQISATVFPRGHFSPRCQILKSALIHGGTGHGGACEIQWQTLPHTATFRWWAEFRTAFRRSVQTVSPGLRHFAFLQHG